MSWNFPSHEEDEAPINDLCSSSQRLIPSRTMPSQHPTQSPPLDTFPALNDFSANFIQNGSSHSLSLSDNPDFAIKSVNNLFELSLDGRAVQELNMTAKELSEDIAFTHDSLGLITNTKDAPSSNGVSGDKLLMTPPPLNIPSSTSSESNSTPYTVETPLLPPRPHSSSHTLLQYKTSTSDSFTSVVHSTSSNCFQSSQLETVASQEQCTAVSLSITSNDISGRSSIASVSPSVSSDLNVIGVSPGVASASGNDFSHRNVSLNSTTASQSISLLLSPSQNTFANVTLNNSSEALVSTPINYILSEEHLAAKCLNVNSAASTPSGGFLTAAKVSGKEGGDDKPSTSNSSRLATISSSMSSGRSGGYQPCSDQSGVGGSGGSGGDDQFHKRPVPSDKDEDSTSHESSSGESSQESSQRKWPRTLPEKEITASDLIASPNRSTSHRVKAELSEDIFAPEGENEQISPSQQPSSSSICPTSSETSSDEKVVVAYEKLAKNKDYDISPTMERRRRELSESALPFHTSVRPRKLQFSSSSEAECVPPKKKATIEESSAADDDVTILEQSLEIVYEVPALGKSSGSATTCCASTATLDRSDVVSESQDISLFLSGDSQSQVTDSVSLLNADLRSRHCSLEESKSLGLSSTDIEVKSGRQVIQPARVASSTCTEAVRSESHGVLSTFLQTIDVEDSNILVHDSPMNVQGAGTHSVALPGTEPVNTSPDITEMTYQASMKVPKHRSPTKYKDICHQSLVPSSQVSSSDSSTGDIVFPSIAVSQQLQNPDFKSSSVSVLSSSHSNSLTEPGIMSSRLTLSTVPVSDLPQTPVESGGTIVAKASRDALKNFQAIMKNTVECGTNIMHENSSISDSEKIRPSLTDPHIHTTTLFASDGAPEEKALQEVPCKSSVESPRSVVPVAGDSVRRTSTPNLDKVSHGVSPNISEEGNSSIHRNVPTSNESSPQNKSVASVGVQLERSDSSKSTLELERSESEETLKSAHDLVAKGFTLTDSSDVKISFWKHSETGRCLFSFELQDKFFVLEEYSGSRKTTSGSSGSSRRMSDVSALTSSSGYLGDKSSSGSSSASARRISISSRADVAKTRLSTDSIQMVGETIMGELEDERPFVRPSARPLKLRTPRTPSLQPISEQSSSDEGSATTPKSSTYSLYKALHKRSCKVITDADTSLRNERSSSPLIASSTHVNPAMSRDSSSEVCDGTESKTKTLVFDPRTSLGITHKGYHYDLDKFFGDLPANIRTFLQSVQLSEEEEPIFIRSEPETLSVSDIQEEQGRMVITRVMNAKLTVGMVVFAKYQDHYYSAILQREVSPGVWNVEFTLDGCQKQCPLEHILPLDVLPRGQECFRRFQLPDRKDSITSTRVVIKGHTIKDDTLVHIACDAQRSFEVLHSHLSMQIGDAERFLNVWKNSQSIVSHGPDVSMSNIIHGKRKRTPASPRTPEYSKIVNRPHRKQRTLKLDPNLDTSFTDVVDCLSSAAEDGETVTQESENSDTLQQRSRKMRRLVKYDDEAPMRAATSPLHSRINQIMEQSTDLEHSDDDSSSLRKQVILSQRKSKSHRTTTTHSSSSLMETESLAHEVHAENALLPGYVEGDAYLKVQKKRGRKPKVATPLDKIDVSDTVSDYSYVTPKKRGRPPGKGSLSSTKKVLKLELSPIDEAAASSVGDTSASHPSGTAFTPRGKRRTRSASSEDSLGPAPTSAGKVSTPLQKRRVNAGKSASVRARRTPDSSYRRSKSLSSSGTRRQLLQDDSCSSHGRPSSSATTFRAKSPSLIDSLFDARLGTIPPQGSTIFKGYTVLITDAGPRTRSLNDSVEVECPPLNKRHLTEQIRAGGGRVVQKFEEADLIRVRNATYSGAGRQARTPSCSSDSSQLVLLCDRHCRTSKYIQCLAVGIPIVSHQWVITACDMNQRQPYLDYLLPAGVDVVSGELLEQPEKSRCTVRETPLLEGDVVFLATSSNEKFVNTWLPLLCDSAAQVRQAPASAASLRSVLDRNTTLVLADASVPAVQLERARLLNKPVVGSEWFIQSVICGYKLPCDYHPSFAHDYHK